MSVLEVTKLKKTYGNTIAVKEISFRVGSNEIVGLLGPNGAGKTTTINMILGVLEPSSGSIAIEGIDLARERSKALTRTNFAAVYAQLPGNMTVRQNLHIFGLLYTVPRLEERIHAVLKDFDLEAFAHTKCGAKSRLQEQKSQSKKNHQHEPRKCGAENTAQEPKESVKTKSTRHGPASPHRARSAAPHQ